MTIKEYLREYLSKGDNVPGTSIEVWHITLPSKGKVIVEYSPETDKADIIHETFNRRNDYYEAVNGKELKETIEFCLGPVVSDNQWRTAVVPEEFSDELEELEF